METAPVRIGITPVLLDSQTALLDRWRTYIEARLQRPVVFKQRQTYRQVIDILAASQLDYAWVCGFPYVKFRQLMKLLAVPVYQGKPLYQSYLIVPAGDRSTRSIEQLRELNPDGFGRGDDSLFEDIAQMANALQGASRVR